MQQITKRIDDKLSNIAKLQRTIRQKQYDYQAVLSGNKLDLPQIPNVLVRFPSSKRQKAQIKNTPRKKNIVQLDRILQNYGQKIKTDDINRIIFASPLKNRTTFQRTFFRSSIYYTIQAKRNRSNNSSLRQETRQQKFSRQTNSFAFKPIKVQQQNQKEVQQPNYKPLTENQAPSNSQQMKRSNVLDSNPEIVLQRRKQERSFINKKAIKLQNFNLNMSKERYSPWKNDELEQQLIL